MITEYQSALLGWDTQGRLDLFLHGIDLVGSVELNAEHVAGINLYKNAPPPHLSTAHVEQVGAPRMVRARVMEAIGNGHGCLDLHRASNVGRHAVLLIF